MYIYVYVNLHTDIHMSPYSRRKILCAFRLTRTHETILHSGNCTRHHCDTISVHRSSSSIDVSTSPSTSMCEMTLRLSPY